MEREMGNEWERVRVWDQEMTRGHTDSHLGFPCSPAAFLMVQAL